MTLTPSLANYYLTAADFSETGKKIKGFERLESGWHFGEGRPPSRDLIEKAIELENLALELGFSHTDAFPGANGEVRHCVYNEDQYYEFTIELDGSVTTVIENAGVESETVSSFKEAKNVLKKSSVWNISDLFIGNIGTGKKRISKDWRSRSLPRTKPSQSSIKGAQNEMGWRFVSDSTDFTGNIHHVSLCGFSMTNYYQKEQSSQTNQAILETHVIETCAA